MAPRSLGEIFSVLKSDNGTFIINYIEVIQEICSHPKDSILQEFATVNDSTVFSLREQLFIEMLDIFKIEEFAENNVILDQENALLKNLRKRYKASTCLEDLFIFSITLSEKQIHKDISKAVISSKNVINLPSLSSVDKTVVSSIKEILDISKALRKENKDLKEEFKTLKVKFEEQNKIIFSLKKSNDEILFNQGKLFSHKTNIHAQRTVSNDNISNHSNTETHFVNSTPSTADAINLKTQSIQHPQRQLYSNAASANLDINNPISPLHVSRFNQSIRTQSDDDFRTVGRRNRPARSNPIYGTKTTDKKSIAGKRTVREFDIFVGGVNNDISEQDLSNHMSQEMSIEPISVKLNRENKYNRSFIVTIPSTQKDQVFNADVWDSNIIVKPFRKYRPPIVNTMHASANTLNYLTNDQYRSPNTDFNSRWGNM